MDDAVIDEVYYSTWKLLQNIHPHIRYNNKQHMYIFPRGLYNSVEEFCKKTTKKT